jgi:hypothetical protein
MLRATVVTARSQEVRTLLAANVASIFRQQEIILCVQWGNNISNDICGTLVLQIIGRELKLMFYKKSEIKIMYTGL